MRRMMDMSSLLGIKPTPRRTPLQRVHEAERERKRALRDEQGWQQRRPLTCRTATHARDGRPYVREGRGGSIRKGQRQ